MWLFRIKSWQSILREITNFLSHVREWTRLRFGSYEKIEIQKKNKEKPKQNENYWIWWLLISCTVIVTIFCQIIIIIIIILLLLLLLLFLLLLIRHLIIIIIILTAHDDCVWFVLLTDSNILFISIQKIRNHHI